MLISQKINVPPAADINGEKSILQSNFVSIFTSLRYLERHLSSDAIKNQYFARTPEDTHRGLYYSKNDLKTFDTSIAF